MKTLALCILWFAPLITQSVVLAESEIVTAAQVNGTWECKSGSFKILALGQQKLQIEFSGIHEYKLADGSSTANTGEGSGIASIEGRVAKFKPEGAEDECLITMRFTGGRLEVEQQGYCGFGNNVTAAGRYHRISTHKPKFGEN
jgi:hypothetical protein